MCHDRTSPCGRLGGHIQKTFTTLHSYELMIRNAHQNNMTSIRNVLPEPELFRLRLAWRFASHPTPHAACGMRLFSLETLESIFETQVGHRASKREAF